MEAPTSLLNTMDPAAMVSPGKERGSLKSEGVFKSEGPSFCWALYSDKRSHVKMFLLQCFLLTAQESINNLLT
jgi:hypothetical protein